MKRIHLLLLRSFIGPFFLIFFIVLFVLLMQFLWRYIDELVGKGLEFKIIAQFLMYTSATLVPMALPLSILMSSLMTFGNLGEKYELTAMKASGISLQRIMLPLIIVVVFISFGAFFFANNVMPYAQLQMRSLLYDIRQQKPEIQIKPGEFIGLITDYSIRVQEKDQKTGMLYNVQIYDHTNGKGNTSIIIADSGYIKKTTDDKDLILTLFHGHSYNEVQDSKIPEKKRSYPHRYDEFDEQQIIIELSGFGMRRTDQSLFKSYYAMDLQQLQHDIDSFNIEIKDKHQQIYKNLIVGNLFKKRGSQNTQIEKREFEHHADTSFMKPTQRTHNRNLLLNRKNITKSNPDLKDLHPISPDTIVNKNSNTSISDSLKKIPAIYVDIDSIYNLLTLRDKSRITGSALSFSRSSKNIIENSVQSLEFKIGYMRRFEIEWHRKFTIAFACLLFLFIGAPLGAIIRKGGLGLPLVLSVVFFIFYYILSLTGDKLVRESILPAYQGMWFTSCIFFIAGVFLTYQAATDSSILNLDTYLNFLKRIFGQRYNIVDKLSIQGENQPENKAKLDNIYGSLSSLEDLIDQRIADVNTNLQVSEFLGAMFALQRDSNLILFDRYYNNTFRIIINHSIFHKKNIRAKIFEFPSFNYNDFQDEKGKLILSVILACTVILAPLVALRQYMKLILLRVKLKKIKELLPELLATLKLYESEF